MKNLALALYCEGNSDEYFLPAIIQRTSRRLVLENGGTNIRISPVKRIVVPKGKRIKTIVDAAITAEREGYNALIIHSDADYRSYQQARAELFDPGYQAVQQTQQSVCRYMIPLIPVREMEAWMLADIEALQSVLYTQMSAKELGLPAKAPLVEKITDPKSALHQAAQKAMAHRPKRQQIVHIEALSSQLSEKIRFERLQQVPAYQEFRRELINLLKSLNILR